MADMSLRLPNRTFGAVLKLGDKPASKLALPARFAHPELDLDWDDDERETALYIACRGGELHLSTSGDGVQHHFHGEDGEHRDRSPWPGRDTAALIEWGSALVAGAHAVMPDLLEDIEEAVAWLEAGFTLYACSTEPAQLDLLEVEIEGEILTLPWLGAGEVSQEHVEGDNHPVALFWSESGEEAKPLARAWLGPTGEPMTMAIPGIDWQAVGLPEDEVLSWLEGTYLNEHVIPDAATALVQAALERMGGLDAPHPRP